MTGRQKVYGTRRVLQSLLLTVCLVIPSSASAASILFAHVANYGPYVTDGNTIAGFLTAGGNTVTIRDLSAAIYTDYSSFDQVWVYDLYAGEDNSATQLANYANIAGWFGSLSLSDQNLIADGRIISSGPNWVAGGEPAWVQNYATQLPRGWRRAIPRDRSRPRLHPRHQQH